MKKVVFFVFVLLLFVQPVFAKHISLSDLNVVVENKKDYYSQNEFVNLTITISPKNDDIAKEMANRKYTIYNYLSQPRTVATLYYKNGPSLTKSSKDQILTFKKEETNWDQGIDSLKVNLSGYTPTISEGLKEITVFEFTMEDADTVKVNVTVVNTQKLKEEIDSFKNSLNEIEKELKSIPSVGSSNPLFKKLNDLKSDLNEIFTLYNTRHYLDLCSRIESFKKDLDSLKVEVKKTHASYYIDECEDVLGGIDINITKAESIVSILKTKNLNYTLKIVELKSEKKRLSDDLNNLKSYYNNGDYEYVIENGEKLLNELYKLNDEVTALVEELQSLTQQKTTTVQTTQKPVNLNVDIKKLGFYAGIGAGALVAIVLIALGLRRYLRRRRWDELK